MRCAAQNVQVHKHIIDLKCTVLYYIAEEIHRKLRFKFTDLKCKNTRLCVLIESKWLYIINIITYNNIIYNIIKFPTENLHLTFLTNI